MDNLKKWIEDEANGEPIEAIVIGEMGWGDYGSEHVPGYDNQPRGKVLTWQEAAPWLDYDFYSGHGAPGCNAVHVWTASRVMFISQYDGATALCCVPRNPCDSKPEMPGG